MRKSKRTQVNPNEVLVFPSEGEGDEGSPIPYDDEGPIARAMLRYLKDRGLDRLPYLQQRPDVMSMIQGELPEKGDSYPLDLFEAVHRRYQQWQKKRSK